MQNNSKTNTILLIIIVILLAVIAFALFDKPQMSETDFYQFSENQKIDKNIKEKEITNDEEMNSRKTFLKSLFTTYPNLFAIRECLYQNNTYFSVQPEGTGDAGFTIYDSKGTIYAKGGGFVPQGTPVDPMYASISPTCTKLIYKKSYSVGKNTPDIIDVYNLQ